MNLTIGFCEIALVTSLFFFQQSWWVGVILLTIAIIGRLTTFIFEWSDKQERDKILKEANDNLTKSLTTFIDKSKPISSKTRKKSQDMPDFIFENYTGGKDDN